MKPILVCFFLFALALQEMDAQDVHWSQPANCLLLQNPAFTGINERMALHANYRSQWNAVNTQYTSSLFAGEYRFGKEEPKKAAFSLGGIFYNDVAGDGSYRTTSSGLTFSCLVKASEKMHIGAGLGCNLVQSALKFDNFSWGTQFNGLNYDSSLPGGELQGNASKWFGDVNAGVAAVYDKNPSTLSANDHTKLVFGYSINHVNHPTISLTGGDEKLNRKQVVFISGTIGLHNKNISLKPLAFYYRQGNLDEITAGSLLRFTIGEHSKITGYKKGAAFSFGALYRVNDAVVPSVQLEKGDFVFGASYDVNVSRLATASHLRGGIEFSLSFLAPADFLYKEKSVPEKN